jgi:hypothetical protein
MAALSFSDHLEGILVVFQSDELGMPQVVIDVPVLGDSVKQKLAPCGEFGAAHKRPECDSTIERLIRSPMPVPWGLVVTNALRIWSACCVGSPTPVSLTTPEAAHLPPAVD